MTHTSPQTEQPCAGCGLPAAERNHFWVTIGDSWFCEYCFAERMDFKQIKPTRPLRGRQLIIQLPLRLE